MPTRQRFRRLFSSIAARRALVMVGPYDTAASGAANWGLSSATGFRDMLTIGQAYRIRQNCAIKRLRFYSTAQQAALTGFYVKIWRPNGSNFDLVATSENLASRLTASAYITADLAYPLLVQEGDYYGYRVEMSSNGNYNFFARTGLSNVNTRYTSSEPGATNVNWGGFTSGAGVAMPIELYATAPTFALIGDSIMAGHPAHYSFLEGTATTSISSQIGYQLIANYYPVSTYQNMGVGGQTTTSIAARFAADVIALKPTCVIIEGGVNDIAGGSITQGTFIANWTAMLAAAQAEPAVKRIVVCKIMPWTNGTTVQMQTRDTWNAALATLAAGYNKAVMCDVSSLVGVFRSGGDVGNLWDINATYSGGDGVHFNSAGHGKIAQAIAGVL